ncbi:MAG: VOC family protein [Rivularia sp. (in: cyanobacteria)]
MTIQGIDHIDLVVGNLEEFVDFFIKLGFQVLRRTSHGGAAVEIQYPAKDQPIIELHPCHLPDGSCQPLGLRHIAFKVDNIDTIAELVEQQQIESVAPPHFYEPTKRMLFSVFDPDGRKLQFVGNPVKEEHHGK